LVIIFPPCFGPQNDAGFQCSTSDIFLQSFVCPIFVLLWFMIDHCEETYATTWVATLRVFHRPPSGPNQHPNINPPHPQTARADGRPTSTRPPVTRPPSGHRPPSTLGFREPPAVSPEHAQARAETFHRIVMSSPRRDI
jgi:hypothetical protein